jgi:hypothetical protein
LEIPENGVLLLAKWLVTPQERSSGVSVIVEMLSIVFVAKQVQMTRSGHGLIGRFRELI